MLHYPHPELTSQLVRLRQWSFDDLPCVEAASTDPDIPRGTTVPEARRRDFATEAVRLASRWALSLPDFHRLVARVHPDNEASRRLLRKCGFTEEGVLRQWLWIGDAAHDAVQFSLLKSDLR